MNCTNMSEMMNEMKCQHSLRRLKKCRGQTRAVVNPSAELGGNMGNKEILKRT